ncbi:MAG: hypothetical protein IT210_19590 [Armatimonadetes bacterium]|nr:hypothetical protein [Armatimonadota bacterium]
MIAQLLVRLIIDIVRMLLAFALKVAADLIGCAIRLLYWSVRIYGWGKVAGVLLALAASLWLSAWRSGSRGAASPFWGVLFVAVLLWGAGWLAVFGVRPAFGKLRAGRARDRLPAPDACRALPPFPSPTADASAPAVARTDQAASLWARATGPERLQEAWQRVTARGGGPGPDNVTVEAFSVKSESALQELAASLADGSYRPLLPRWVEVPKPHGGTRRLAILPVRDRIVQHALYLTLSGLWDRDFAPCSFAYRPGRGAHQAVAAVEKGLSHGRIWVVDADIESFFDSVPHARLLALLEERLPDERLRWLVQVSLGSASFRPGVGLPQGAPTSPLLANLYLHGFDTALLAAGHTLVRYADDFVILCATRPQAEDALRTAERLLAALSLRLSAQKTRIVSREEGFQFLGFVFDAAGKRPSPEAIASVQDRLAEADNESARHRIAAGWQGYFQSDAPSYLPGAAPDGQRLPETMEDGFPMENPLWMEEMLAEEPITPSMEDWPDYRARFVGRADVYARAWTGKGRHGYAPAREPLNDSVLIAHLHGEAVIGTYLLHPDSTVRSVVLDIDGPDTTEAGQRQALAVARQLVAYCLDRETPVLWEDSGGKGYHLWFCFGEAVPAGRARQWGDRWLDAVRPFPDGVMVELFPKQDSLAAGALGSVIRLPLGRHPITGRQSLLLDHEGAVVADFRTYLASAPFVRIAEEAPIPSGAFVGPIPPEDLRPVLEACAVLRELAGKAARTRQLRHTERQALLYLLGGCGESGRAYLHQVMAQCANYDPRITQRWLQRLQEGRKPIRCKTLQDWLKDYLPGVCPCDARNAPASPVDFLKRPRQRPSAPVPVTNLDSDWAKLSGDLFGDERTEQI